ncbi:MAG: LON peptidase substrate-binding domain-containing protein, partial [Proteobacteria bacterium]|nr:LON peptidase substrate-binding domain-containing protein [Pseudomonadota bacterium]
MTEKFATNNPQIFYSLPLRDIVLFPQMTTAVLVGRDKSVKAIQSAVRAKMPIFAVTQIDPDGEDFNNKSIHKVGVLCNIMESTTTEDGTLKVVLRAITRGRVIKTIPSDEFFACEVNLIMMNQLPLEDRETAYITNACLSGFEEYSKRNKKITPELIKKVRLSKTASEIAYTVLSFLNCGLDFKQEILEEDDINKALFKIHELLQLELSITETEEKINKQIQEKITKGQRDLYLNEQLKHIKKELGHDEEDDFEKLKKKIAKLKLTKETQEKCNSELSRLEKTNPFSSEAGVIRNYLEWIVDLPWNKNSTANKDLKKAKTILDKNHYALKKIKDRILEF